MTRFILVHGAFENGTCWEDVAAQLRAEGHDVVAPDLPGSPGEGTAHDQVTFQDAARTVTDIIDASDAPVVLVGHSNGGMVVTQAAADRPGRVAHLVYLTAFRPLDGEGLLDLTSLPEGADDGVQANTRVEGASAHLDPDAIEKVLAHDCAPEVIDRIRARIGPQPLRMFDTAVQLRGAELPPVTYVVCTEDGAIPEPLQRLMAEREPAHVVELTASHSPYYSRTDDVVRILADAATVESTVPAALRDWGEAWPT